MPAIALLSDPLPMKRPNSIHHTLLIIWIGSHQVPHQVPLPDRCLFTASVDTHIYHARGTGLIP